MPLYFTGKHVSSPTLVASPARTFRDFIEQFINLPVPLSVTAGEYHAMGKKEKSAAKQVGYAVACTFPRSPWEGRKIEHAQAAHLLILDIDNSEDAKPFVRNPGALVDLLRQFNFAAYQTISSTAEAPRLRVMIEALDIPVDRYPDAVLTVAGIMGLSQVTRESVVVTQPMFRPTVFSDQDAELEHPTLVTHYDGRPFRESDISGEIHSLPGIASGSKPARAQSVGHEIDDFLTFFQFPVQGLTLAQVEEALGCIDADCTRSQWLEIAAALKHQFAATQDGEAYEVFDKWSATGSKYEGEKDTATVWKSLSEQPRGRKAVTIRSLLKRATEAGWNSDPVKEDGFKQVSDWIMFECKTAVQIMSEGVHRVAAAPLLSHIEKDALLQTMVMKSREAFATPISKIILKAELRKREESLKVKRTEAAEVVHPPWSLGFVFIAATGTFLRHRTRQEYDRSAFDSVFSRKLLPTMEELQNADKEVNESTLHTPKFLPSLYLLNHLKCQTVDDITYNPAAPEDIITREDGKLYVNIYRRSYREADKSLASYAEDVLGDHLVNLIREPEYRTVLLDWMAHNVQYPGAKIRWALLIQGVEGCGKTLLAEVMRSVLGNDNIKIINSDSIKKGWNEWVFGSQIVCIEELRVAGLNRHEVMNTLKEPITNDYVPVNERAKNTRVARNVSNYMAFTNFHDAIVVSEDSRRWGIIKSWLQHKSQVDEITRRDPEYFPRFAESLRTHAGGYRWLFENRTITSTFRPNGPAPATTYLREMVADTSDDATAALSQLWEEGTNPYIQPDMVAFKTAKTAMEFAGVKNVTDKYLTHILRNMGFTPHGKVAIGSARESLWVRTDKTNGQNPVELLLQRAENSSNMSES